MLNRTFLAFVSGLVFVLSTAASNVGVAQTGGSGSSKSSKLETAKAVSAASGRPILAVAGLES